MLVTPIQIKGLGRGGGSWPQAETGAELGRCREKGDGEGSEERAR